MESGEIEIGFIGLPYALKDTILSGHRVARYENLVAVPEAVHWREKSDCGSAISRIRFFHGVNAAEYPHWDEWAKDLASRGFNYRQARNGPTLMSALLSQVAANLGVTLFPEHSLKHEGVVFRHITPPVMSDLYAAWNPANVTPLLHQFLRAVGAEV